MIDMRKTIVPKSDQLNADDLIAGPLTIKVTGVRVSDGEQCVAIDYEGGEGKPWKPCKSTRRLLVKAWGHDGEKYIGRSLTLFCDPAVKWAGEEVGGIRISHMSDIEERFTAMVTMSRGRRSPVIIEPLKVKAANVLTEEAFLMFDAEITTAATMPELQVIAKRIKAGNYDNAGRKRLAELYEAAVKSIRAQDEQILI
jgi:hypothetical protein